MEVMQVLHMNKGEGEASYAKNSSVQRNMMVIAKSIVEEAVVGILCSKFPESFGMADFGCSSGPNTLTIISEIIDTVHTTSCRLGCPMPEMRVSLNDLPRNDFNYIFKALPEFYKKLKEKKGDGFDRCFVSCVAGSFYGRLYPSKSLHFVHSSSSLQWLSQCPYGLFPRQAPQALDNKEGIPINNKGKLYLSKTSPVCVVEAYLSQFQKDFSLFLKSRSEEMVPGGRMVLSLVGRTDVDPTAEQASFQWELLAQALMSLASEGLVEEEKIDSFNAPYYAASPEKIEFVVETDGSFLVDRLETFEIFWDEIKTEFEKLSVGQRVANMIRAVVESILECQFGREIMDVVFERYGEIVNEYLSKNRATYVCVVVSLIKRGS